MRKIVFVVVEYEQSVVGDGTNQKLLSTPELDELVKERWEIYKTENVTAQGAKYKSVIQVTLRKER